MSDLFYLYGERYAIGLSTMSTAYLIAALTLYVFVGRRIKNFIAIHYTRVMDFMQQGRFGLGGSARFIGLIEEWNLRWHPKSLPSRLDEMKGTGLAWTLVRLGEKFRVHIEAPSKGYQLFMGRSLYSRTLHIGIEDDRHMLTIGGSRSGKGATCIIPNLLTFEGSALVIDPKGTNTIVTARRRREMGQAVYIVDPFQIVGEKTDSFNPLEQLDVNSIRIREALMGLADALVVPENDSNVVNAGHWDDGARSVLSGFIAQLMTDPKYRPEGKTPTLPMIRDFLALGTREFAELIIDMINNREASDGARDVAARIRRGVETEEIANILSNVDKHSTWLSYPSMKRVLGSTTFRFAELKEKPTTIYLVIPPELLDTHRRFLRMFVNLALAQMPMGGKSKIPVLFMLDEFLQLGRMDSITRAFRLLAGYNFCVWPFVQEYDGLKKMYGSDVSAYITNSRAVQVFAVDDEETKEYVSKRIGDRSMQYVMSGDDSMKVTRLRNSWEVGIEVEKNRGLQYILRTGQPTMVLQRVKYFERKIDDRASLKLFGDRMYPFAGMYDQDPDYKTDV